MPETMRGWEGSHVLSQDGNRLVPICPESLILEANAWGQMAEMEVGGEKNKTLSCLQRRGSDHQNWIQE